MDTLTLPRPRPRAFASLVSAVLAAALFAPAVACGGDDDAAAGGDPKVACDTMCKDAAFAGSNLLDEGHETNCFCTGGGAGEVTAAACTTMCESVGKPGSPFTSGAGATKANACQCQ